MCVPLTAALSQVIGRASHIHVRMSLVVNRTRL